MAPQEPGLPIFHDERAHRVYEGTVCEGNEPLAALNPNGQLDLDHGTKSGTHSWTDSSCWLKDLVGKRVRLTVEVIDVEPKEGA